MKLDSRQVLILGSGFAGSVLAWVLARQGQSVAIVDRGYHPRFAIGESSTPLADFLLERISERFELPELRPLSRWGSWCATYPQLRRGKKRGFSYYAHRPDEDFTESSEHERSLLVAASAGDATSDTHWMRSDVDHWLLQQAARAGAKVVEGYQVAGIESHAGKWRVGDFEADWLVDATGAGGVVPRHLGVADASPRLRTRTAALFGHFAQVGSMSQWLDAQGLGTAADPFDCDDAAQHHLLADGWIWMLRFSCNIASVGIVKPCGYWPHTNPDPDELRAWWQETLDRYPTWGALMAGAELVGPQATAGRGPQAGTAQLGWIPRISRLWAAAAGPGWLALPSTVGLIDPLHSTGIAHALSGVERAADLLLQRDATLRQQLLQSYATDVVQEVEWIDSIVSLCFAAMHDFELFTAVCSFYFIAAIHCERELSQHGQCVAGFLGWSRPRWRELVETARQRLPTASASGRERQLFMNWLRAEIAPWNDVGLLDPALHNRLARSAAPK
jgi:tetracycline 7-halogenase / FADH2 O2-dependent halogenase